MFLRWQELKRHSGTSGAHYQLAPLIVETVRKNGIQRQINVAYLGSIRDYNLLSSPARVRFWARVKAKLDRQNPWTWPLPRQKIENEIAKLVPRLTKAEETELARIKGTLSLSPKAKPKKKVRAKAATKRKGKKK